MSKSTIPEINVLIQATKDGSFTMKGISCINLLHRLIREYRTYSLHKMWIDPDKFDDVDKKLILSHIVDSEEYEHACICPTYLKALYDENYDNILKLLDDECDEVYREDMEEHGAIQLRHRDNGEIEWRAR